MELLLGGKSLDIICASRYESRSPLRRGSGSSFLEMADEMRARDEGSVQTFFDCVVFVHPIDGEAGD